MSATSPLTSEAEWRAHEREALQVLNDEWHIYARTPDDLAYFLQRVEGVRAAAHKARYEKQRDREK